MQSLTLEDGASVGLLRYLRRNAEANVYPLFQVLRRHQVRMWRLETAERGVMGALVEGGQQLSPFVPDTWLVAEDFGACERLLDLAVAQRLTGTLSVPSRFGSLLAGSTGAVNGVAEKHFVSSRQSIVKTVADASIVWLTRSVLNGLTFGPSVLRLIGSVQTSPSRLGTLPL
jgi:hypothetical protein